MPTPQADTAWHGLLRLHHSPPLSRASRCHTGARRLPARLPRLEAHLHTAVSDGQIARREVWRTLAQQPQVVVGVHQAAETGGAIPTRVPFP